jgi:glycerate 2-kinase
MQPSSEAEFRQLIVDSYLAAVAAADPLKIVAGFLPAHNALQDFKKTIVVGAGKAAASMAMAVENYWPKDAPLSGLVVTRYGHGLPCTKIDVIQAGHPVPDEAGEKAAQTIFDLVADASPDDLVIVLVSGGGSSLLSLPVPEVPMSDLKRLTQNLLASGAPIQDMNVVRKHLSRIQGGRLAQICKAKMLTLVISDVVGDDLSAIASGPTVPDPSTYADAIAVLAKYKVEPPNSIRARLDRGQNGLETETPKPGDACFAKGETHLIATAIASLNAGAQVFERAGVKAISLGDNIEGEASLVGQQFVQRLTEFASSKSAGKALAIISGGECTVTLKPRTSDAAKARGGRCSEFLLGCLVGLEASDFKGQVYGLAADTDGIDGSQDNAGALFTTSSQGRAAALNLPAKEFLDRNDAYGFFHALGDLVSTGPTLTNVNDYRVILLV